MFCPRRLLSHKRSPSPRPAPTPSRCLPLWLRVPVEAGHGLWSPRGRVRQHREGLTVLRPELPALSPRWAGAPQTLRPQSRGDRGPGGPARTQFSGRLSAHSRAPLLAVLEREGRPGGGSPPGTGAGHGAVSGDGPSGKVRPGGSARWLRHAGGPREAWDRPDTQAGRDVPSGRVPCPQPLELRGEVLTVLVGDSFSFLYRCDHESREQKAMVPGGRRCLGAGGACGGGRCLGGGADSRGSGGTSKPAIPAGSCRSNRSGHTPESTKEISGTANRCLSPSSQ